jgi:hypothetical protein
MEDDNQAQKLLCTYQSAWSISVLLTVTVALTMPFANIVIWRVTVGEHNHTKEIDLDVDVLKCFTRECQNKQDEAIAKEVYFSKAVKTSISHPSFVEQTKLGSMGTILCFLFTGIILTAQVPSLLYGCSSKIVIRDTIYPWQRCIHPNPETSLQLMVVGSVSLLFGLLWYAVVMVSVLNGGSFIYGYWITLMTVISTLLFVWLAYRDKNIWDSLYMTIPDLPESHLDDVLVETDDLLDCESLDVYQTAPSLSPISLETGQTAA